MAGLDELFAQIPVQDIATKLGVDEGEVGTAVKTLVPTLLGGLHQNIQGDNAAATQIESAAQHHAASGLLDGGVSVDQLDEHDGDKIVANIFGGNNSGAVASALAGTGAPGSGSGDLMSRLLPILAPIVLAYVGKQFAQGSAAPANQGQAGGGLADVLGNILGGAAGGGGNTNPLGSILGSVLGGGQGNAIGTVLGGLLGGKK